MKRACENDEESPQKKLKVEENMEKSLLTLPKEILISILDVIESSDRKSMTETCYYALDVINEKYSKKLCMVLTPDLDYSINGRFYRTFSGPLVMRQIENMKIVRLFGDKSFPDELIRFLELFGGFITNLEWDLCWGYKFTNWKLFENLETITFRNIDYIDLTSGLPQTLKCINILGVMWVNKIKLFKSRHNIAGVEVMCKKFMFEKEDFNDDDWFLLSKPLYNILKEICQHLEQVIIEANFNINGNALMELSDVIGIDFDANNYTFEPITSFKNLQSLNMLIWDAEEFSPNGVEQFPNVKSLGITNNEHMQLPVLTNILSRMPSLETLVITDGDLCDKHIYAICELKPNLKHLTIISEEAVFTLHPFADPRKDKASLKSLTKLEELVIVSNNSSSSRYLDQKMFLPIVWPTLPKLKKLHLEGFAFANFEANGTFKKLSRKFQSLEDIGYGNGSVSTEIFTILKTWPNQLTELSFENVNPEWYFANRTSLIQTFVTNGNKLKKIAFEDYTGLKKFVPLEDMVQLFSEIPSLKEICVADLTMTRLNFKELSHFIKENIVYFMNGLHESTISFVLKELMQLPNHSELMKDTNLATITALMYLKCSPKDISKVLQLKIAKTNLNHYDLR